MSFLASCGDWAGVTSGTCWETRLALGRQRQVAATAGSCHFTPHHAHSLCTLPAAMPIPAHRLTATHPPTAPGWPDHRGPRSPAAPRPARRQPRPSCGWVPQRTPRTAGVHAYWWETGGCGAEHSGVLHLLLASAKESSASGRRPVASRRRAASGGGVAVSGATVQGPTWRAHRCIQPVVVVPGRRQGRCAQSHGSYSRDPQQGAVVQLELHGAWAVDRASAGGWGVAGSPGGVGFAPAALTGFNEAALVRLLGTLLYASEQHADLQC